MGLTQGAAPTRKLLKLRLEMGIPGGGQWEFQQWGSTQDAPTPHSTESEYQAGRPMVCSIPQSRRQCPGHLQAKPSAEAPESQGFVWVNVLACLTVRLCSFSVFCLPYLYHVYICLSIYVVMCLHIYLTMYVCMYVCMHDHLYHLIFPSICLYSWIYISWYLPFESIMFFFKEFYSFHIFWLRDCIGNDVRLF